MFVNSDAKMQGTYVQICQSNANCRQCGTQSPVNTGGMWTEFICERGVSGDQIKVIKDQSWVAFCEVEVYGSEYYVDKGNKNELKKKRLFFLLMFLFLNKKSNGEQSDLCDTASSPPLLDHLVANMVP